MIPALLCCTMFQNQREQLNSLFSCTTSIIVANMSKNSFFELLSRPFWGEKRCKIISNFDTDQIFSWFFSKKIINNGLILLLITIYLFDLQHIIKNRFFVKNSKFQKNKIEIIPLYKTEKCYSSSATCRWQTNHPTLAITLPQKQKMVRCQKTTDH